MCVIRLSLLAQRNHGSQNSSIIIEFLAFWSSWQVISISRWFFNHFQQNKRDKYFILCDRQWIVDSWLPKYTPWSIRCCHWSAFLKLFFMWWRGRARCPFDRRCSHCRMTKNKASVFWIIFSRHFRIILDSYSPTGYLLPWQGVHQKLICTAVSQAKK